jgi:hypothetical protein
MENVKEIVKPDWKKIEDEYIHGITIEGLGTCLPSLTELADCYHIKDTVMTRRSAEGEWFQKRQNIRNEIKRQKREMNEMCTTENCLETNELFKPLEKEYASPKIEIGLSEELTRDIIESIVDSLGTMCVTIHFRDKSLSIREIGDIVSNLYIACINEFITFTQKIEEQT